MLPCQPRLWRVQDRPEINRDLASQEKEKTGSGASFAVSACLVCLGPCTQFPVLPEIKGKYNFYLDFLLLMLIGPSFDIFCSTMAILKTILYFLYTNKHTKHRVSPLPLMLSSSFDNLKYFLQILFKSHVV